jgi:hypothetical protein
MDAFDPKQSETHAPGALKVLPVALVLFLNGHFKT